MSEWYNDLKSEDFGGKHVVVILDDGMTISGALSDTYGLTPKKENDTCSAYIFMAETVPVITGRYTSPKCLAILVCMEDNRWRPLDGITSVDLVWDERDWERIDVRDVRHGDAVVVNGRLCTVDKAWPDDYHPQVVTVAPSRMRIDLCLVSCALRRKAKVPVKPGFYKDRTGAYWVRSFILDIDKPWRAVDSYAFDSPVRSEEEMLTLMPLTPVHFVDGKAPEPGDELASVMRITSKGVTFTTEAA